jgi:hypothetical protein
MIVTSATDYLLVKILYLLRYVSFVGIARLGYNGPVLRQASREGLEYRLEAEELPLTGYSRYSNAFEDG